MSGIQDETHNAAIAFHHKRRSQSSNASVLDEIPGVGPARKAALLQSFRSVKAMKGASKAALAEVVPQNTAEAVFSFFHPLEEDGKTNIKKERKE